MVHGLWMRGHVDMWPLRRRLQQAGFCPHQFSYPSLDRDLNDNADALSRYCRGFGERPLLMVAHSFGGVVALAAVRRNGPGRLQRLVALGSPLAGSNIAHSLSQKPALHWTVGRAMNGLLRGIPAVPTGLEVGSIAGTRPVGVGRLIASPKPPSDGTVSVAETRIPGLREHLCLPLTHTGLMLSVDAFHHTEHFLLSGRFATDPEQQD